MNSERVDIYDENNQPLGLTKTRAEVHQQGYWHRTVHLYLVNSKGEFLVHLRSPYKDQAPNCLDTRFGGHVTVGNDYLQTATKELQEEIGLVVQTTDLVLGKVYKHEGDKNKEYTQAYYYKYNGDISDLSFNDDEVVEVKWMPPDEIVKSMTDFPTKWAGKLVGFQDVYQYRLSHLK